MSSDRVGRRKRLEADIDAAYLGWDKAQIRRMRNLRLIPTLESRSGGRRSYAEWAHTIGMFQALLYTHIDAAADNWILDVGCGRGVLGIAAEPFLGSGGRCVGIDVSAEDIEFCRRHYDSPQYEFLHATVRNRAYAPDQKGRAGWDLADEAFDAVTALSVWTHLEEEDARFYMNEVARVLKTGGKALVTAFVLDSDYRRTVGERSSRPGRFHRSSQDRWLFDQPAYGSSDWHTTGWAEVPEWAIAITKGGIESMLGDAGLNWAEIYSGTWKELPGLYFQDILVLEKG